MQNAQEKVWFVPGAQQVVTLAHGPPLKVSPITLPPFSGFRPHVWPPCRSGAVCVRPACHSVSGPCTWVASAQSILLPDTRMAHSSLPAGVRGRATFLGLSSTLSNRSLPSPLFFSFLELIAVQLTLCFPYLSFYLLGYFPSLKV